jgi:hypothetical protein
MATAVFAAGWGGQPPRGERVASHDPSRSPPLTHHDWGAWRDPPYNRPDRMGRSGRCLVVSPPPRIDLRGLQREPFD